ncbi:MAG: gliding motility-associated ABC transporter permease subunit GldF [Bacteroidota bacterium]
MFALFKKEVRGFFSSLSGYIVVGLFLIITGLLLWIIPDTGFNIGENGYANLDGLFILAPWLFLFLVPAITMRMFAEEKKTGTIELLLTRPISDLQLVGAKYLAALSVVLLALLPTTVYYLTIYRLSSPVGNVDSAGILGSYIGLILLCSAFAAVGNFASAATDNQIVSFLLSLVLCFFLYTGFDFFSELGFPLVVRNFISQLGMSEHYAALSRGVIDSRDVIYFLSITFVFLFFTRFLLEKRKW